MAWGASVYVSCFPAERFESRTAICVWWRCFLLSWRTDHMSPVSLQTRMHVPPPVGQWTKSSG